MPRRSKITTITFYGTDEDQHTLLFVRDTLSALKRRKVSLAEAARFCVERQGQAFLEELLEAEEAAGS